LENSCVPPLDPPLIRFSQVQAIGPGTGVSGQAYGRIWPSLARMWKEEGFRGFMKGNGINVIRVSRVFWGME
jgi:hypothetical protein